MSDGIVSEFEWQLLKRKEDESEDPRARVLHLSKRMRDESLMNSISQINGVEAVQPNGPYSVTMFIGRCFEPDFVVQQIETAVKTFISGLIVPDKTIQIAKG